MQFPDRGRKLWSSFNSIITSISYWEMQFPDRGRKRCLDVMVITFLLLRNAVPRQGTETITLTFSYFFSFIEKCSSPTGDGNSPTEHRTKIAVWIENAVPRQGTETLYSPFAPHPKFIEKCSSPTGDGNDFYLFLKYKYRPDWEMQFPDRGRKQ